MRLDWLDRAALYIIAAALILYTGAWLVAQVHSILGWP